MLTRRRFLGGTGGAILVLGPGALGAQEGVFLDAREAPRVLLPEATEVTERRVPASAELRRRIRELLGRPPTLWEGAYTIFTASSEGRRIGAVVVVEEIGKHRPITYAVAVDIRGAVRDLAVLAYREAYGGEVRERRFVKQYVGKTLADPLLPSRDIRNISGATLSVLATGRAVRKAIAVLKATGTVPR